MRKMYTKEAFLDDCLTAFYKTEGNIVSYARERSETQSCIVHQNKRSPRRGGRFVLSKWRALELVTRAEGTSSPRSERIRSGRRTRSGLRPQVRVLYRPPGEPHGKVRFFFASRTMKHRLAQQTQFLSSAGERFCAGYCFVRISAYNRY